MFFVSDMTDSTVCSSTKESVSCYLCVCVIIGRHLYTSPPPPQQKGIGLIWNNNYYDIVTGGTVRVPSSCTQEVPSLFSKEKSPSTSAEKESTSVHERLRLKWVKWDVCTVKKFGSVFVPKTY